MVTAVTKQTLGVEPLFPNQHRSSPRSGHRGRGGRGAAQGPPELQDLAGERGGAELGDDEDNEDDDDLHLKNKLGYSL